MDTLEPWLGLFYSDPEYLHFQEAFNKVPDKKFIEEGVTGPGRLHSMAGKGRAGQGRSRLAIHSVAKC